MSAVRGRAPAAMEKLARKAREASSTLSLLSCKQKGAALRAMAGAVLAESRPLLRANAADVRAAERQGLPRSLIGRLKLDEVKIKRLAQSFLHIAKLPDPVGRTLWTRRRPNGLLIRKVSVPIGVILIIYESRPNVTADCMALCLKSGNSVLLKGGREAARSNRALFGTLRRAAVRAGVPEGAFGLVPSADRKAVQSLLKLDRWIDVVIPRGGEGLIRRVARESRIPVIKHTKGVCHVFVDRDADAGMAERVVLNAKVQNPAVCNAMETLLVHRGIAERFLPRVIRRLREKGVEVRGCARTRRVVPDVKPASEEDWVAEYLDLILAVRVVDDLEAAIAHIRKYGSQHSDAILTENRRNVRRFADAVDSACVFVNCSTRFSDGGEFGMGAEMGISTDKLHARGPMGLEELTSYKYVVVGSGQVRA